MELCSESESSFVNNNDLKPIHSGGEVVDSEEKAGCSKNEAKAIDAKRDSTTDEDSDINCSIVHDQVPSTVDSSIKITFKLQKKDQSKKRTTKNKNKPHCSNEKVCKLIIKDTHGEYSIKNSEKEAQNEESRVESKDMTEQDDENPEVTERTSVESKDKVCDSSNQKHVGESQDRKKSTDDPGGTSANKDEATCIVNSPSTVIAKEVPVIAEKVDCTKTKRKSNLEPSHEIRNEKAETEDGSEDIPLSKRRKLSDTIAENSASEETETCKDLVNNSAHDIQSSITKREVSPIATEIEPKAKKLKTKSSHSPDPRVMDMLNEIESGSEDGKQNTPLSQISIEVPENVSKHTPDSSALNSKSEEKSPTKKSPINTKKITLDDFLKELNEESKNIKEGDEIPDSDDHEMSEDVGCVIVKDKEEEEDKGESKIPDDLLQKKELETNQMDVLKSEALESSNEPFHKEESLGMFKDNDKKHVSGEDNDLKQVENVKRKVGRPKKVTKRGRPKKVVSSRDSTHSAYSNEGETVKVQNANEYCHNNVTQEITMGLDEASHINNSNDQLIANDTDSPDNDEKPIDKERNLSDNEEKQIDKEKEQPIEKELNLLGNEEEPVIKGKYTLQDNNDNSIKKGEESPDKEDKSTTRIEDKCKLESCTEELKKSTDSKEEVKKSTDTEEELKNSTNTEKQLKNSTNTEKKLKKSTNTEKQLKKSTDTKKQLKKWTDTKKELKKSTDTEEQLNNSIYTEKQLKKSTDTGEELKKSTDTEEELKKSTDAKEQLEKSTDTEEQLKKSTYAKEELKKSTDTEEELKKSTDTEEELKKSTDTEEELKKSTDTEEELNKSTDTEEELKKSTDTKKEEDKSTISKEEVNKSDKSSGESDSSENSSDDSSDSSDSSDSDDSSESDTGSSSDSDSSEGEKKEPEKIVAHPKKLKIRNAPSLSQDSLPRSDSSSSTRDSGEKSYKEETKPPMKSVSLSQQILAGGTGTPIVKKKRGRPRKYPLPEPLVKTEDDVTVESVGEVIVDTLGEEVIVNTEEDGEIKIPKKRGRKPGRPSKPGRPNKPGKPKRKKKAKKPPKTKKHYEEYKKQKELLALQIKEEEELFALQPKVEEDRKSICSTPPVPIDTPLVKRKRGRPKKIRDPEPPNSDGNNSNPPIFTDALSEQLLELDSHLNKIVSDIPNPDDQNSNEITDNRLLEEINSGIDVITEEIVSEDVSNYIQNPLDEMYLQEPKKEIKVDDDDIPYDDYDNYKAWDRPKKKVGRPPKNARRLKTEDPTYHKRYYKYVKIPKEQQKKRGPKKREDVECKAEKRRLNPGKRGRPRKKDLGAIERREEREAADHPWDESLSKELENVNRSMENILTEQDNDDKDFTVGHLKFEQLSEDQLKRSNRPKKDANFSDFDNKIDELIEMAAYEVQDRPKAKYRYYERIPKHLQKKRGRPRKDADPNAPPRPPKPKKERPPKPKKTIMVKKMVTDPETGEEKEIEVEEEVEDTETDYIDFDEEDEYDEDIDDEDKDKDFDIGDYLKNRKKGIDNNLDYEEVYPTKEKLFKPKRPPKNYRSLKAHHARFNRFGKFGNKIRAMMPTQRRYMNACDFRYVTVYDSDYEPIAKVQRMYCIKVAPATYDIAERYRPRVKCKNLDEDDVEDFFEKYWCDQCEISFWETKINKRRHEDIFHEEEVECDLCDRTVSNRFNLRKHREIFHQKKIYTCKVCEEEFTKFRSFQMHVWMTHPDVTGKNRAYFCNICQVVFYRRASFKFHYFEHLNGHIFEQFDTSLSDIEFLLKQLMF